MRRGSGGHQLQRLDVTRPHRREVAVVQRGQLRLSEALHDRQHRAVDEADFQIGIGREQLGRPLVVARHQILDVQSAAAHLIEHGAEGFGPGITAEQVVDLDQHGRGNHAPLARLGEKLRAGLVRFVVTVERPDQNRGVDDQRDGWGSNTSRLAISLKSPRPELNAPMQVRGGCSPSSSPNSCSSASRTSWGTATPRSRAARCARSRSSASISTLVFGVAAIAKRVALAPVTRLGLSAMRWPGSGGRSGFAWRFEWLFAWSVEWLFAIRCRAARAIPHGVGDRGAAVLPTSPRPIEVWS
jgi:hypothetical protein